MRKRELAIFGAAMLAGALGGSLLGPHPAQAVAREIIDLQHDVTLLLQGQKELSTANTQDHAVLKTLVEQSNDNISKLTANMGSLQKSVQDVSANSGARLDTMATQVQGISDNLEEIKARLGKLNQQLTDIQNTLQSVDSKLATAAPSGGSTSPGGGSGSSNPPPSADTLYSNGLRDYSGGKYDLARQEFQDYLKYYGNTDLASNAQFYLGEIAYAQKNYDLAISEYDKVLVNYPKSFKAAPARLKKGLSFLALGQKASGVRELREVIRLYPGTEEAKTACARLKSIGAAAAC